MPRFFPRRYSTPELAMRKHALKYQRDDNDNDDDNEDGQSISNKSCQTDLLGLDKYLQRSPPNDISLNSTATVAKTTLRAYKKLAKKPKVRSVAVHCERRRLTMAAFKSCQKFKHVYRRKISLSHPSSATTTTSDDGRRDSGVLPKLRLDRTEMDIVQRPAAARSESTLKLPRIPTRDARPELPDRTDDSGGGTRLARLTRPQSTGSGSGSGGCDGDRKLAYFRANSAPKIDSRYYTTLQMVTPSTAQPSERERSTTPGSSDTADTTLDMSFVRRLQPADVDDVATTAATEASTSNTRTVSTSTTFTEPVFPIVFSCESVLRHPLDGGYVSHTESHRFSVHYAPVEDVRTAAACTDTDDGSRSSLIFTSAGACQNERCLTGDSISVTVGGKPMTDDSMASHSTSTTTTGERRLVIEHLNSDVQFKNINKNVKDPIVREPSSDYILLVDDGNNNTDKTSENGKNNVKIEGFYVLGKGDTTTAIRHENDFEKNTPPTSVCNKIIDTFGNAVAEKEGEVTAVRLKSHAHTDDMPLQKSNERNYERLTQNNRVDSTDRTVSNQSPKFDDTETQPGVEIERQNDLKSGENDSSHANELDQSYVYVEPTNQSTLYAEQTKQLTNVEQLSNQSSNFEIKLQPIDVEAKNQLTNTVEPIKQSTNTVESTKQSTNATKITEQSINVEVTDVEPTKQPANAATDLQVDPIPKKTDTEYLTVPLEYSYENTEEMSHCRKHQYEKNGKRGIEKNMDTNMNLLNHSNNSQRESTEKRHTSVKRNLPNRLYDNMSRKRDDEHDRDGHQHVGQNPQNTVHFNTTAHSSNTINHESIDRRAEHIEGKRVLGHNSNQATSNFLNKINHENFVDNQHHGLLGNRPNDDSKRKSQNDVNHHDYDNGRYGTDSRRHINSHVRTETDNTNSCRRCTNSLSHKNYDSKNEGEGNSLAVECEDHHNYRNSKYNDDNGKNLISKRRLESVDESTESTKESNYIGGFLFGEAFNKKQPQKLHEADIEQNERSKYSYYDESKKVNFSLKPNDHRSYGYYGDYAPKTRHSPRDEDCTVFADVPTQNTNQGCAQQDRYSTAQTSYYSQLDDKNTDSDESLTDSLEDCKYEGAAISYFLALNGQKSAVTFTLKMPNTLQSRLNRRKSQLKKHLHVSTTVRKTTTRVRTRHKGCQTLWTEEKGVQVQRGSTANATARKPVVDDHKVLTTLLAGLDRYRVSENQIRVVGGQKMVSEGNQTERPPTDRHTQTQSTRDVATGPGTPENNAVATGTQCRGQHLHAAKKFSSDNALMVGVVRQNKYKGKEALDGAKNDQLLTLSKGWINFYTLRADSADTDAHGNELD